MRPALKAAMLDHARAVKALRAAIAVQRSAAVCGAAGRRYFTYVLQLQRGKLYVGESDNVFLRLADHIGMTPASALWVRAHGPVQRVVEICEAAEPGDEAYKTLEYMDMFGWENVRGAAYCSPSLRAAPRALRSFRRADRRFRYMSREEIEEVVAVATRIARAVPDVERSPSKKISPNVSCPAAVTITAEDTEDTMAEDTEDTMADTAEDTAEAGAAEEAGAPERPGSDGSSSRRSRSAASGPSPTSRTSKACRTRPRRTRP